MPMMDGAQYHMALVGAVLAAVLTGLGLLVFFFARAAPAAGRPISDIAGTRQGLLALPPIDVAAERPDDGSAPHRAAHDTVFILPDISNYTRFMTGSRFSVGHAQHIIFCLINAMIEAATSTVELSKLEGDAALFFVDASRHRPEVLGQTVLDIFAAFFRERSRLADSNLCPCRACRAIDDLDLKVFVHRGLAARFSFRGSVDHFGTDVIVIHRIMKNGVRGHRYVIVTGPASDSIELPAELSGYPIEEQVEHIGRVHGTVYEIGDEMAEAMARVEDEPQPAPVSETMGKLGENLRSLRQALGRRADRR